MPTAHAVSAVATNPNVAAWTAAPKVRATAHRAATYATDHMHPGVYVTAIGSYLALLVALWVLFGTDLQTGVSLWVCTAYFGMYFGVPLAMYRLARKTLLKDTRVGTFGHFLRGDLETIAGSISGWGALAQVIVVPVSLTFGLIAMGIILKLT